MALVSSHWGGGARIRFALHGAELNGRIGGKEVVRWDAFSPPAVAFAGERQGRAWILGREFGRVSRSHQGRVGARARTVVTAALGAKALCGDECGADPGLFDKFLEHAVRAVGQREDISPLPCQVQFFQFDVSYFIYGEGAMDDADAVLPW